MYKRQFFCFIFVMFLIVAAGFQYGCKSRQTEVADSSKNLAGKLFAEKIMPQANPVAAEPVNEKDLYLDASISLKGFAGKTGTFAKVLEKFGDEGYRLYKYGADKKGVLVKEQISYGQEIFKEDFYNLQNNPDDKLIAEFTPGDTRISRILITDGVYSELNGKSSSVVFKPISDWINSGRTFGIFAFRSSFDKELYSEKLCSEAQSTRKKCVIDLPNTVNRPFYAFIFSPSLAEFKILHRQFQKKFPAMNTFVFGGEVINSAKLALSGDVNVFDNSDSKVDKYDWRMLQPDVFLQAPGSAGAADLTYTLDYEIDPDFPAKQLEFTNGASEYYQWNGQSKEFDKAELPAIKMVPTSLLKEPQTTAKRPVKSYAQNIVFRQGNTMGPSDDSKGKGQKRGQVKSMPSPAKSDTVKPKPQPFEPEPKVQPDVKTENPASVEPHANNQTVRREFKLSIPQESADGFGFYFLRMRTTFVELKDSIGELSTLDDSVPENADRTYRFKNLIEALVSNDLERHSGDKLFPPIFLTVEYR